MLAEEIDLLNAQLQRIYLGDDLQILRPTLSALSILSAASELRTGAAPILLGASIASIGMRRKESAIGLLPDPLARLAELISNAMLATLLPKADTGSRHLLPLLVSMAFVTAITGPVLLLEKGGGLFSLELLCHTVLKSGVLTAVCREIVIACGATQKSKEMASDLLAFTIVLLFLQTIAAVKRSSVLLLVENLQSHLLKWLERIEPFVSDAIRESGADEAMANTINVCIQQAKIALQEENAEAFIEALNNAEQLLKEKESEKLLKERIPELRGFIDTVWRYAVKKGEDDMNTNVGVIQG